MARSHHIAQIWLYTSGYMNFNRTDIKFVTFDSIGSSNKQPHQKEKKSWAGRWEILSVCNLTLPHKMNTTWTALISKVFWLSEYCYSEIVSLKYSEAKKWVLMTSFKSFLSYSDFFLTKFDPDVFIRVFIPQFIIFICETHQWKQDFLY